MSHCFAENGALDTDSDADASKPQAILDSQDRRAYGRAYGRAASKLAAEQAAEQAAEHVAQPLGFAIVGMGRAGKIHLACLQEAGGEAVVCWLVDTNPAVLSPYAQGARVSTNVAEALRDDTVTCVIVCAPTPHHAPLIRAALAAGKHVFAEKPLCCGAHEAGELFALAQASGMLLHTAYNRRSDPAIQARYTGIRYSYTGNPLYRHPIGVAIQARRVDTSSY